MTEVIIEPITETVEASAAPDEEPTTAPLEDVAAPAAPQQAPKAAAKKRGRPPGAKNKPKPPPVVIPAREDSTSPGPRKQTNFKAPPIDFETQLVDFLLSRKTAERDRRRNAWSSLGQLAIGNRR
jgi:hypothetical protein